MGHCLPNPLVIWHYGQKTGSRLVNSAHKAKISYAVNCVGLVSLDRSTMHERSVLRRTIFESDFSFSVG